MQRMTHLREKTDFSKVCLVDVAYMEQFRQWRLNTLQGCEEIARKYNVLRYWRDVQNNNHASSLFYHNLTHTAAMVCMVDYMAAQYKLVRADRRMLVVAALFHDYNHTGGLYNDDVNICNAIHALTDVCGNEKDIEQIVNLIDVTHYPFNRDPVNVLEMIIRDADILYGCNSMTFKKVIYVDLYNELLTPKPDMSFFDYVKGQSQFLINTQMFTVLGRKQKEAFIENDAKPFWFQFGIGV